MKKIVKTIGIILITIAITTLVIEVANAYEIDPKFKPNNEPFNINYSYGEVQGSYATIIILQIIAGTLLYFAAPVAVIMLAMAGWQMTTGGAETEKLEQSKKNITWTIIGLLAIILSYSIVKFAISFVIKAADVEPLPDNPTPPAESTMHIIPESSIATTPLSVEIERLLS